MFFEICPNLCVGLLRGDPMGRYKVRLAITFTALFLVLSIVLVLFYISITRNFITSRAEDSFVTFNLGISARVDSTLKQTYETFVDLVDEAKADGLNPVTTLNNDNHYDLVMEKTANGLRISGIEYTFTTNYLGTSLYDIPISIYSLSETIIGYDDEQRFVVMQYDNTVALIDAKTFFDTVLSSYRALDYRYVLFNNDGHLYFDEDAITSNLTLGNAFGSVSESSQFFSRIQGVNQLSGVGQYDLFGEPSFIAYTLLDGIYAEKGIYFGQVINYYTLLDSMAFLTNSLMFAFIIIVIIFLASLMAVYRILQSKNEDIESARLIHYYVKPYILKMNSKGKIFFYNASFKRNIKNFKKYKSVSDILLRDGGTEALEKVKKQEPFVAKFSVPSGEIYIRFIPVRYALTYALIGDDITKLEETYKYHREIAFYNTITNEPNMNYMKADVKSLVEDAKRFKHRNVLVIFGIFKYGDITKVIGEKLSGEVLVYVSKTVKDTIQDMQASLYHISFDRFGILFENISSYEVIETWADRLNEAFEKPIDVDKNKFVLQFRIGQFNIDSDAYQSINEDQVYDNAILALNRASAYHSNKPVVYDVTFGQSLSRRQVIETDMMSGIERHEFVMYLQPQYHIISERIVGFEALVRWDNPKYRLDSPSEFIEIAENNNMIIDIGRIVMNETFKLAKDLENYNIKISMNVSPVQILQAGFVSELVNAFEQYGLREHSISIEITETFLMTSFDIIIEKLKLLQSKGFDIHLDDFGTGYSSLLYLKELPINAIKIDKEFVKHSTADKHSRAIINMIIALAKNLDLEIIAEGVEDDKQFKFLQKSGADVIQGFYLGKAMKYEDAIALLKAYNIDRTASLSRKR